jgi:hypothetical protein
VDVIPVDAPLWYLLIIFIFQNKIWGEGGGLGGGFKEKGGSTEREREQLF